MAAPPSPKSEKAETKKEEASTAKKAPVPEDPAPTNARDSSGEILSALKSLLDQYDAKVREYKDAPKENPTVKEQPPVVREQPRVSVKKPSAQKKETTSKAPWSFLANFLADSEEAARPLGTQEYGLIYSYFQSFLAQPQPETPKTPPKPNTKAEKPEPAPVQRKASTQPPKSSKPKKKSTAGPSFDMFSSFQYLLADQKAPKKPQEPVYTSGSLAEFLQSLLAEPTAPSKKRSKPSTSWNWQDILAAPQAQKKQSTAGKVFENIYKSNSMKDLGNAFSSLLAGSEPSKSSMDLSSFKSLFASLLASNDFDQAKKSFRKLVKDSVNPDIDTSRQEEPVKEFFSEWSASSNEAPFHILDFLKSLLADQTPDQTKSKGKLWDAVFTEPEEPLVFASTSEPQTSTTCQKGFRGVDSTWDSFCSSNCPKGKCPVSLCQCETGDEKCVP